MFRKMRRSRQELTPEECVKILEQGTSGVLAVLGDEGYPYAVPLSYVYHNEKIFFHCAKSGHKLDAVKRCCKASFCVIGQDQVAPEKYTSYFKSVIAFGKIRILEDKAEIFDALEKLAIRYFPGDGASHRKETIQRESGSVCMLEFTVEHMTGKQAKELTNQREEM